MKKLYLLSTILIIAFVLIYSCSSEEEDNTPPPSIVITPKPEPEPTPAPTQYTLTVTAGEGGTVSSNGGTYDEGTSVTISATPNEGYEFVGWEGSDSVLSSLSVTLNANTTVQALFERIFTSKSERFSDINETTGYFKNQEFFTEYLTGEFIEQYLNIPGEYVTFSQESDEGEVIWYRVFGKAYVITDINGDYKQDIIAFANGFCSFHPDLGNGWHSGKIIIVLDFQNSLNKQVFDIDAHHVNKLEVNDFNSDGISDVLLFKHDTYKNMYVEQEDGGEYGSGGGLLNIPPKKKTILHWDSTLKMTDVGMVGDAHSGTSGDVDNDGDIDFVYWPIPGEYNNEGIYTSPYVALNNGNLNFSIQEIQSNERWYATQYDLFDVNADGNLDLIVGWRVGPSKRTTNNYHDSLDSPILIFGDGTGNFNTSSSISLSETFLTSRNISAGLLGTGYSDFDQDGDVDIVLSTTREEPDGTFEDFTYYDNYYLILLENQNGVYVDVTEEKIDGSFNQNGEVANFYMVRTIDKNDDGNFEIIPDNFAHWGDIINPTNLYWENTGGQFVRR